MQFLVLLPLLTQTALAQAVKTKTVSPAEYEKLVNAQPAEPAKDALQGGDLVSIKRKGEKTPLTGTYVYRDDKGQRLFVRTRPGVAPTAVPLANIEVIERIVPDSGTATHGEVQTLSIFNGDSRSDAFFAPNATAAERDQLAAVERAGAELAEAQESVVELEDALRATTRALTAPPDTGAGSNGFSFASVSYQATNPGFGFGPYYNPGFGYGMGGGFPGYGGYGGFPGGYGGFPGMLPFLGRGYGQQAARPAPTPPSLGELQKALASAEERAARANQAYTTARSRLVVNHRGQVVAVRSDEK